MPSLSACHPKKWIAMIILLQTLVTLIYLGVTSDQRQAMSQDVRGRSIESMIKRITTKNITKDINVFDAVKYAKTDNQSVSLNETKTNNLLNQFKDENHVSKHTLEMNTDISNNTMENMQDKNFPVVGKVSASATTILNSHFTSALRNNTVDTRFYVPKTKTNITTTLTIPRPTKLSLKFTIPKEETNISNLNLHQYSKGTFRIYTTQSQFKLPVTAQRAEIMKNDLGSCYKEGTQDIRSNMSTVKNSGHSAAIRDTESPCICKQHWYGKQCSIPNVVYRSMHNQQPKLRNTTRRVINAIPFNIEFEFLEARLNELYDVVDVFLIMESNYTNYGDPKPLRLLHKLRTGYLKDFHSKIVYVLRDTFPQEAYADGWVVEREQRASISKNGLNLVDKLLPDDIYICNDADEIPTRQVINFLRHHDGYTEPFGFVLRWTVFGFFWKQFEPTMVRAGSSIHMLQNLFKNDFSLLRNGDLLTQDYNGFLAYQAQGFVYLEWFLGTAEEPAGWHCSWCLPVDKIWIKLVSAQNGDFPRWGDYREKLELNYIRHLVKSGTWFDDKSHFDSLVKMNGNKMFVPNYFISNKIKFLYLLDLDAVT